MGGPGRQAGQDHLTTNLNRLAGGFGTVFGVSEILSDSPRLKEVEPTRVHLRLLQQTLKKLSDGGELIAIHIDRQLADSVFS
jgi:hypothetical protein